jgi:2-succinyl-6-hydroxy-2,4-cyclohexadiene-1-carboxylate synthase
VPGDWESDEPPSARLHAVVEGQGRPLVLVHGFAQTQACWGPVADDLATDHQVCRIDAPGHGGSGACVADLRTGAGLIAERGGAATYVGYSMGGRFLLHVALAHPELVRGLVLIGATAGIDDPEERAARRRDDEAMADRLERDGLPAFLAAWLAQPLFAGLPEPMQFRDERESNGVDGLAESLRRAGTGSEVPLWARLDRIEVPALVVAGEADAKFTAAGRRLVRSIGANAELAVVPGAGHAVHLEDPAAFLGVLRPWLARHDL